MLLPKATLFRFTVAVYYRRNGNGNGAATNVGLRGITVAVAFTHVHGRRHGNGAATHVGRRDVYLDVYAGGYGSKRRKHVAHII